MDSLKIYVLYNGTTSDYPGKYVLRAFAMDVLEFSPEPKATFVPDGEPICVDEDLEKVKSCVPNYLSFLERDENDDPVIMGTFI